MKGTRFLKPACWLLCAMMLIGQLTVLASAADGSTGSSTTSSSLADIKEMLNAASYEEYRTRSARLRPSRWMSAARARIP